MTNENNHTRQPSYRSAEHEKWNLRSCPDSSELQRKQQRECCHNSWPVPSCLSTSPALELWRTGMDRNPIGGQL